jgi:hypothetical protein
MPNELSLIPAAPVPPRVSAAPAGKAPRVSAVPTKGAPKGKSAWGNEGGGFGSRANMAGGNPKHSANIPPQVPPQVVPPVRQAAPPPSAPPQAPEPAVVYARPVMGQATSSASAATTAAPLEPYPEIDKILSEQAVGMTLSRAEASALLDALSGTLTRISSPENSNSSCIQALGPGAIEKATTLRTKLAQYVAGDSPGNFSDFTSDEFSGADRVLACASALAPEGSSSNSAILALLIFGGVSVLTYFIIVNSGKK